MDWVLMSRDQLLDWDQVADEEMAICLQDLKELHYGLGCKGITNSEV